MSAFSHCLIAYDLSGVWNVDVEKTIQFNADAAKFSDLRLALLKCDSENTKLKISEEVIYSYTRAHSCSYKGKSAEIESQDNKFTYKVLHKTTRQMAILNISEANEEYMQIVNWLSENEYWIDSQGEDPSSPPVRYFYRKWEFK